MQKQFGTGLWLVVAVAVGSSTGCGDGDKVRDGGDFAGMSGGAGTAGTNAAGMGGGAGASGTSAEPPDDGAFMGLGELPGPPMDGTGGGKDAAPVGPCYDPPPPGAALPPPPKPYSGGACPEIKPNEYNTGFQSGGLTREFAFRVPENYDPNLPHPLIFAWYHITGDAKTFISEVYADSAADLTKTLIVVPQDTGMFPFIWPSDPLTVAGSAVDLAIFDDLLACISEQYNVASACVGTVGVSAGGLWTTYLGMMRNEWLATNQTISGGHPAGFYLWVPPAHVFPAVVFWGGPTDMLGINFHQASLELLDLYKAKGHYTLRCEHTGGHGLPDLTGLPLEKLNTPLDSLWDFVRHHPYWLAPGDSPWITEGFPISIPPFCRQN